MTGSSPSIRLLRLPTLLLAILAGPALRTRADDPPKPPALTDAQKERLKERDQLGSTVKFCATLSLWAAAINAAEAKHKIEVEVFGVSSEDAIATQEQIADLQEVRSDWAAAAATRRGILSQRSKSLGEDHWKTIGARVEFETCLAVSRLRADKQQKFKEIKLLTDMMSISFSNKLYNSALEQEQQVLSLKTGLLGENHIRTARSHENLGVILSALNKHSLALEELSITVVTNLEGS